MDKQIYSCTCPVHRIKMTTDRLKTVKTVGTGKTYTKPLFYCDICKAEYMFIDEFKKDYKSKLKTKSGSIIFVRGKRKVDKCTIDERQPKDKKIKPANTGEKYKLKLTIDGYERVVRVMPKKLTLPNKCISCGTDTNKLLIITENVAGKEIRLEGKECRKCGEVYLPESLYNQYKNILFPKTNVNNELKPHEDKGISSKARNQIVQYLQTNDQSTVHRLRRELVNWNEAIDPYLKDLLSKSSNKDQVDRILYVGIRRDPQTFLLNYWKEYKSDPKMISTLDFQNEKMRAATINLIGKIVPYPKIFLDKLAGDHRAQELIGNEVKKGNTNLNYINFLSDNKEIINEEWIQQIICKKIDDPAERENFLALLNLNSDEGIKRLNAETDLTTIYHIIAVNKVGIDKYSLNIINKHVRSVQKAYVEGEIDEILQEYLDSVVTSKDIITRIRNNPKYAQWLLELTTLRKDINLLERIYIYITQNGIYSTDYENILASNGSKYLLEKWVETFKHANITYKHKMAKQILTSYREKAASFFMVVNNSGDEKLIQNVRKMAEKLGIPWTVEIPEFEVKDDIRKEVATEKRNICYELKSEDKSKRQSACGGKYMDDFGKEFDFTDLEDLLFI